MPKWGQIIKTLLRRWLKHLVLYTKVLQHEYVISAKSDAMFPCLGRLGDLPQRLSHQPSKHLSRPCTKDGKN